jgi:hypothetical protein
LVEGSESVPSTLDQIGAWVVIATGLLSAVAGGVTMLVSRSIERSREARLRMDTKIEAVGLFEGDRSKHSNAKTGGALLALANLEELEFALTLAGDLWVADLISSTTAIFLVEEGLHTANAETQRRASRLLLANAHRVSDPVPEASADQDGAAQVPKRRISWPSQFNGSWMSEIAVDARRDVLASTLIALTNPSPSALDDDSYWSLADSLAAAMSIDPTPDIRQAAARSVSYLLEFEALAIPGAWSESSSQDRSSVLQAAAADVLQNHTVGTVPLGWATRFLLRLEQSVRAGDR